MKSELPQSYSSPRQFVYTFRQAIEYPNDSRRDARIPKRMSLRVQPLDDDFVATGEPFWAISSDISRRGMGFIVSDPMFHEYVRITLVDHNVSVIATTRHCTSIGVKYPLYLIGVEFMDEYLV